MKKIYFLFQLFICLLLTVSCSKEDNKPLPDITVTSAVDNIVMSAESNVRISIDFTAATNWTADTDVEWATVSPKSGKAGNMTISLIAKEPNNTGVDRKGVLTLTGSNDVPVKIAFTQTTSEVVLLKQANFDVPCEGQDIALEFATNVEGKFKLMVYSDVNSWIKPNNKKETKSLIEDSFNIRVLPNETRDVREAVFQVYVVDSANSDNVLKKSEKIYIRQAGEPVATSTDYSADKQVRVLQKHSVGNGVPIVIMGDGFVDTEIASGYYDQVMEKAMENLFTEEPIRSLREYFDIWAVTAVSKNNAFGNDYSTAFEAVLAGNGSSNITGSDEKVHEYLSAIKELTKEKVEQTLAVVVLNTSVYAGTTAIGYRLDGDKMSEFAIGYCPVIENLESETFRRVLTHECIGHGLAKLLDEYSYETMGAITTTMIKSYREFQSYGWAMNVDFTGDKDKILWKQFLQDPRYSGPDAFGEVLGAYEGACTYWTGAWRPTNESMMRSNINGFNAPSREAIYKRVMSTAYGETWQYDYETFVNFDLAHLPRKATRSAVENNGLKPLPAPIFVNKRLWQ